jgi:hypothetical protein
MKIVSLIWVPFCISASCIAQQLEEVEMHEIVFKPYESVSVVTDVGAPVGNVYVSLSRNNSRNVLSKLSIKFGELTTVDLGMGLLSCVSNPVIEAPMFYYTELGNRTDVPSDWFSSVLIPFSADEQESDPQESGAIIIPLYPSIEFEFTGFKISRVKVRKSSEEVRVVKTLDGHCPADLIEWAKKK